MVQPQGSLHTDVHSRSVHGGTMIKSANGCSRSVPEGRTQSFTSAVEKFVRDSPSTILHLDGTLSNHGQQPRTGICAQV